MTIRTAIKLLTAHSTVIRRFRQGRGGFGLCFL